MADVRVGVASRCDRLLLLQLNDNVDREKRHRADVEKARRKVENDLKMTQETVEELERMKHDLEENARRSVGVITKITTGKKLKKINSEKI